MSKILIVEDDEVTAHRLQLSLSKQGYEVVDIAKDTLHARNKIAIYQPDLILLDISLDEDEDGFKVASYINENYHIPFIFLSSHSEASFLQSAQHVKPYGYLVKPFEPNTLRATIEMALAKFEEDMKQFEKMEAMSSSFERMEKLVGETEALDYAFSQGYNFDTQYKELSYNNETIKLSKREKILVHLLLLHIDHAVSYEQIIANIWEDHDANFNSLRTLIWRLRSKLPTEMIESVSGVGYRIKS